MGFTVTSAIATGLLTSSFSFVLTSSETYDYIDRGSQVEDFNQVSLPPRGRRGLGKCAVVKALPSLFHL